MRSQTFGDKQREAQQRKRQEELWKKLHPENSAPSPTPENADKLKQGPEEPQKKDTDERRTA